MKFKAIFVLGTAAMMAVPVTASAHDNGYQHRHQNNSGDRILGTAIGAIAGGVLGSNLAGGGVQDEGTALGAVLGGAAGYAIAGGNNNRSRHYYGNNGYYNGGYNNGSYYNSGHNTHYNYPSYGHTNYYQAPPRYYSQPRYINTYGSSYYGGNYYRQPGVSLTISTGNNGYYGGHNYYGNRYRTRHRRRHYHSQGCRH